MSPETFVRALTLVVEWWKAIDVWPQRVEIEYFGGEVMTVPVPTLNAIVTHARTFFPSLGIRVRDGVQSNLLGSHARIAHLRSLFEDRIGTSVDHYSDKRKLAGSTVSYRNLFAMRNATLSKGGARIPAIYTMDAENCHFAHQEAQIAAAAGYDLTFRPVYPSRHTNNRIILVRPEQLHEQYLRIFHDWFLKQTVILKPCYDLVLRRLSERGARPDFDVHDSGCHFRTNCASGSLHVEPDGRMFQCGELCDQDVGLFGDTATGQLHVPAWSRLMQRHAAVLRQCAGCDYYQSCQGGCMAESFAHTGSLDTKSPYCEVWKALFAEIDRGIDMVGADSVANWLRSIEKQATYALSD
jgi:radical SAM protein with 4Fe4S-binding SPASM domain